MKHACDKGEKMDFVYSTDVEGRLCFGNVHCLKNIDGNRHNVKIDIFNPLSQDEGYSQREAGVKPLYNANDYLEKLCAEGLISDMEAEHTPLALLKKLCYAGLSRRYSDITSMHNTRLEHEIEIINVKGLVAFFLIVQDFVGFAKSEGLMVSPGSGAVTGSLAAYCLGITEVDPIKNDLLFERFLNHDSAVMSNAIRIDVEIGGKERILEYASEKYGKGMPPFLEMLGIYLRDMVELSIIKDTIEAVCAKGYGTIDLDSIDLNDREVYEDLCSGTTEGILYFERENPHTYSTGGWQDVDGHWHIYHPPVALENEDLFRAIMPKSMNDLIAFFSLDRYLPEEHVEQFIHNKNNPNNIVYECPYLEPILGPTYGCLVYQEQVMLILQDLGGFSLEKSDICRRVLSRRNSSTAEKMRKDFINGAMSSAPGYVSNRIDEDTASAIYDRLWEESRYCFNRAHAVAFVLIVYEMAWLWHYYRTEFRGAVEKYKDMKSDILP